MYKYYIVYISANLITCTCIHILVMYIKLVFKFIYSNVKIINMSPRASWLCKRNIYQLFLENLGYIIIQLSVIIYTELKLYQTCTCLSLSLLHCLISCTQSFCSASSLAMTYSVRSPCATWNEGPSKVVSRTFSTTLTSVRLT